MPNPLTVRLLAHESAGDAETVRLGLQLPGGEQEVFYRFRGAPATPDADAWATLALPLAMRLGLPLRIADSISPSVVEALQSLVEIHACWYPGHMQPVPLEFTLKPERTRKSLPAGVASFFSGGVDSFYTMRKHRPELSHLLFARGFDIALSDGAHWELASSGVRKAAAELELGLIEVETNVRDVTDRYLLWGREFLMAAMAPAALLLGDTVRRCRVPAEAGYGRLAPYGCHPLTTHLFASPTVEMVYSGADVERVERIRAVASDPVAQKYLRVCWQNVPGEYNCQRCHKCLAAMCLLRVLGVLDSFTAFRRPLDLHAVAALRCFHTRESWAPTLALAQERGADPELIRAMLTMSRLSRRADRLQALGRRLPPALRELVRHARRRLRGA